jgi:hypothetical protein
VIGIFSYCTQSSEEKKFSSNDEMLRVAKSITQSKKQKQTSNTPKNKNKRVNTVLSKTKVKHHRRTVREIVSARQLKHTYVHKTHVAK